MEFLIVYMSNPRQAPGRVTNILATVRAEQPGDRLNQVGWSGGYRMGLGLRF